MENKRNNVLLTIIGVATLLVAIVGASFAYFSATGGTATQNVNTGTLKISAVAGAVNQSNIKPAKSTEIADMAAKMSNGDVVKLPITVNTTGTTISSEYNIFLTTTGIELNTGGGEGGALADVKWELVRDPDTESDGDEESIATGDFTDGNVTKKQLNTSAINIPNGGTTDEYKLLIYILDTDAVQDQLQGLTITAFATVEAKQK